MSEESAYATLAADVRGHSSWFLTRTNKEHQATMEHPWMKSIYDQSFDRQAYVQYLLGQLFIFQELEVLCSARKGVWPISLVYDELLHRTKALEEDLKDWCGSNWREVHRTPSTKVVNYLEQLRADSADAWLLFCHHFLQYNAVLSGGQYLGKMVAQKGGQANFFTFSAECQPTHARVQKYLASMDKLEISDEQRERMLNCMRDVYKKLLDLFDEAQAIQAGGGKQSPKAKKGPTIPPPPMTPEDRPFMMSELLECHAQAGKALILTSVLGRIYDVTGAKEFFGKGGPYEMFSGHDGTYNLAVMSLKKAGLDKFQFHLDDEDKECLADWIAYFDNRFGRPIGTLRDKTHSVQMKDLPRAKKIPFADLDEEDEEEEAKPPAAQPPASRL